MRRDCRDAAAQKRSLLVL